MMVKKKERIRYKYRKAKDGVQLKDFSCPVCGSKRINQLIPVGSVDWDSKATLLAECWGGDTLKSKPQHLFLISLADLPTIHVNKVKKK